VLGVAWLIVRGNHPLPGAAVSGRRKAYGSGPGKQDWPVAELGEAVEMMRLIKRAICPEDLFNPSKIFVP
jgi:FAD/FMN-containing dehydrogenase